MKISEKQNVITWGYDKYRAITAPMNFDCKLCAFYNSIFCVFPHWHAPCESHERKDGRDVYFKLINKKK